jgi:hypothetical protein
MKALSVRPPWAWAILHAGKTVENRARPTQYRGPLVIHSARTITPLERFPTGEPVPPAAVEVLGALVGVVQLVDCLPLPDCPPSPWAVGPWCWLLADPRPLARPVPFAGQITFFDVPEELIR